MANIKIQNGTARGDEQSLCLTCSHALIRTDQRGEHRICMYLGETTHVQGNVSSCNQYRDSREPDEWDLEKIAWVISADKHGRVTGFAPPGKKENT